MDVNFDDLGLTERQSIFVKVYVSDNNGTKAAIAAGFSEKGAAVTASRLLKQPNVQTALARIRAAVVNKVAAPEKIKENLLAAVGTAEGIALTAESLMFQLAEMGMTQGMLKRFLTQQDGHLYYDFSTATPEELAAISPQIAEVSFTSETRTEEGATKDAPPVVVRTIKSKVKWADRKAIIELMGRFKTITAWAHPGDGSGDVHIHVTRNVVGSRNPNTPLASPDKIAKVIEAHRLERNA